MAVQLKNNAVTTLAADITSSATSIPVADGSVFPALSGSGYTYVTFEDTNSNREIVKVTAISSNTLTVVRAQDNTTARAFSDSDKCELRITAALLNDIATQADTDTNTEYTAGSGLTLTGTQFSNSAPDQTVALTGAGTTTISGTYPNFTITGAASNTSIDTMTGDGTTTALTLSSAPATENQTAVYIDGVYQSKSNYSVSGTTLTFSTAPPNGSAVEVALVVTASIGAPSDGTVTSAKLSGDLTLPGDLSFTGNNKAIFGAGSDLQIYHSGSASVISDEGTGNLLFQTNGTAIKLNKGASENMLVANVDGSVDLYYDDAKKLATTSTGIDVTGTVTADGLTVDTSDQVIINHSADGGGIRIDSTNATNTGSLRFGDVADNYIGAVEYNHTNDSMSFYVNNATRMTIDSSGNLTGTMFNATNGEYDGNLNDLKKTGFYRSKNSNSNNPSYAYYSVVVYGNQGNVTAQIATLLSGPATYVRSFNTSWTSWVRIDD